MDKTLLEQTFDKYNPEIVFHLAAQPLVRLSYGEPVLTYETNVIGTLNVLEAARKADSVRAFVNVTTDKCYENLEVRRGYKEDDRLGGYDMYSSSKACSEILSASYRRSFLDSSDNSFALATARAGNVIGGGDWALDRLIPDCVRAIESDCVIKLRNPKSVRPWQFVLEPLSGYLLLGKKLLQSGNSFAQSYNFGPYEESAITVEDTVKKFISFYKKGEFCVQKDDTLHEAGLLMLNIDKVQKILGWMPVYSVDSAIEKTAQWYNCFYRGERMYNYTMCQIKEYERIFDGKITEKSC